MNKNTRSNGFTLVELLVVVAIIGILAALAVPALLESIDRAKQKATVGDMRSWGNALGSFYSEKGSLPVADPSIVVVREQLVPYAVSTLRSKDHWGNDFKYYPAFGLEEYTFKSLGKDGLECPDPSLHSPCLIDPEFPVTWKIYENDMWVVDGIFTHVPG